MAGIHKTQLACRSLAGMTRTQTNRLEQSLDLGPAELFPIAREAILTWKLQESAGVIARPVRRVHVGQIVDLWLNPVWPLSAVRLRGRDLAVPVGSCEVIEVIDVIGSKPTRMSDNDPRPLGPSATDSVRAAGFVYRTLPGHLESGEQTFLVSVGTNGRLGVSITSESVPGHPLLKAVAPISVATQRMMAKRYAEGLKRMLRDSTLTRP